MPDRSDRTRSDPLCVVLEAVASAAAVGITLLLPLHAFWVYLCFGTGCGGPEPEEIRTYRVLVGLLALSVATTLALAARRGGGRMMWWHGLVGGAGALSAALFAVPAIG